MDKKPRQRKKRSSQPHSTAAEKATGYRLDAFPDRIDLRDWYYQPTLKSLPDTLLNNLHISSKMILDQGQEGACTGFALAAVVNYLRTLHKLPIGVSPRMLYEMARRYDEWPGENYEGSSARGAMKGWVRHGVCLNRTWRQDQHGIQNMTDKVIREANQVPGGAYYRIKPGTVRDLHAALNETGILYATLMVHEGWAEPGPIKAKIEYVRNGRNATLSLPVIQRKGRSDGGHAIAIVGYTQQGFVIQNSWGSGWGAGGFALLPYEDYLVHTTDVWVAQLGVPVSMDLWEAGATDIDSGRYRGARSIPLSDIRPYVIDVGNNGKLSDSGDYWTTQADLDRLFTQTIPAATKQWKQRRIVLYLHGGLNSEGDAAKRIVAMRDVMLDNEIYPLHVMWESDFLSTMGDLFTDLFTDADRRAGGSFLDNLTEAKDRALELTLARSAGRLWGEMKENAELASNHSDNKGAMQLVTRYVDKAKKKLAAKDKAGWELHVVGHSAGSIFAAHALGILSSLGIPLKTVQFLAPAIRTDLFKDLILPAVESGGCPLPSLYVLSDELERGDSVGPYGKSLLYLVSNAFEGERGIPLLGMQKYIDGDKTLAKLYCKQVNGRSALVVSQGLAPDKSVTDGAIAQGCSASRSHGGFDNDPSTLNSVLYRILETKPKRLFTGRDLEY
jgi:Papain family cysteine protease